MFEELTPEETRACEKQFGDIVGIAKKKSCSYDDIKNHVLNNAPIDSLVSMLIKEFVNEENKTNFIRYINQLDKNEKRMAELDGRNRGNTITKTIRNSEIDVNCNPDSAWTHYYNHLQNEGFENIDDILSSSKNILEMLKKETEPGHPVKGAVVGNVQSGKTANMEALMSLAADNGWNMFIILSGTIDSLREQTEDRMIGDLRKSSDEDPLRLSWKPLKPLIKPKDFEKYYKMDLGRDGNERYLSVILKNVRHLKSLINNLYRLNNIERMNLIVIDDEADLASVTTNLEIRTMINRLIIYLINGKDAEGRTMSRTFHSVNYICYTATPYAVLLNESKGLYPDDFIFALTPSKRYFGLDRVFGSEIYPGMNIIKVSEDISYSLSELDGHPENMPSSMKDCIAWFICCVAVLRQRNFGKPVSLLMNIDSKTRAHTIVDETVIHYLTEEKEDLLKRCRVMYEEKENFTKDDLEKSVWDYGRYNLDQPFPKIREFPSYEAIEETIFKLVNEKPSRIPIDEKGDMVFGKGIHVCVDNCKDDADSLDSEGDYTARLIYPKDGDPVLAETPAFLVIGGNTLSRGLTIKGLVSTYFRRINIRQADTLLQMGRWFGYRNGYELLPRIWMDSKAKKAFEILSIINESLLERISEYSKEGMSPGEYSVRVMDIPEANMLKSLTARNKMHGAVSTKLDFSGSDKEFHKYSKDSLESNMELLKQFIANIGVKGEPLSGSRYLFRNVPKDYVLDFLDDFDRPRERYASSPDYSIRWMHKAEPGSMDNFNIVLSGNSNPSQKWPDPTVDFNGGEYRINKILRNQSDRSQENVIQIKTVRDKGDMIADIPPEIMNGLTKDEYTALIKGDIRVRSRVKEMAGLEHTPLLALYVAKCPDYDGDIAMAAWYIPKETKSSETYDVHDYVYLEEEI